MKKTKAQAQQDALFDLAKNLKNVDTIYTVIRHVSSSGMSREISVKTIEDGNLYHYDYLVGEALGLKLGKHDGLVVKGCGMDMGFHLVDRINSATGLKLKHRWI